jgi:hypothetical protein
MEFLTWLVFFGALAAEGTLIALIIRAVERYKERRRNVYYIYRNGITSAKTYHQYRDAASRDESSVYPDIMKNTEYRFK